LTSSFLRGDSRAAERSAKGPRCKKGGKGVDLTEKKREKKSLQSYKGVQMSHKNKQWGGEEETRPRGGTKMKDGGKTPGHTHHRPRLHRGEKIILRRRRKWWELSRVRRRPIPKMVLRTDAGLTKPLSSHPKGRTGITSRQGGDRKGVKKKRRDAANSQCVVNPVNREDGTIISGEGYGFEKHPKFRLNLIPLGKIKNC